jgi:hypothetical protein
MNVPFKGSELWMPFYGATAVMTERVVPFVIVTVFDE